MVEERPLGTTLLALFQAVASGIELNFGILMLAFGNPLPTIFPSIDTYWIGILLIILGALGLFLAHTLWAGGASNWVLATALTLIDAIIKIMLPVTYGTSWIAFAATLELDVVALYYLTRPSTTPFFGGDGVLSVLSKFKIEMEPRMKEIRFTLKLVRKSSLSIVVAAIIIFYLLMAPLAPFLADPTNSLRQTGDPNMIWKDLELQATVSLEPQSPSAAHPFGTVQNQYAQNFQKYRYGLLRRNVKEPCESTHPGKSRRGDF